MINQQPIDLLDQYGIDFSSKLTAYMSSDYMKDEAKYGIYDFAVFFNELGLKVDFDTRKEGELLVRYFLACVAGYVIENEEVNFDAALRFAREKTDEMMEKLGIPKKIVPTHDSDGRKLSLKARAILIYQSDPDQTNQELIEKFVKELAMKRSSAIVYASMVQHKWKS